MTFYAFSGLLNGLISTAAGAIVFFLNPQSRKNVLYALYCVSLSVWSYFYCAWQMADDPSKALFYTRALMMGAIFIPTFHYHHILSLFDLGSPTRKRILHVAYGLTAIYFLSNLTPLFIERVEPKDGFPFWPVPGLVFHPYLIMFVFLLASSLVVIWDFRNKTTPQIRNSMAWVAFATLLGYGGGATNFPLWYDIPIKPYLNFTVSFYVAINALLFFRHKLLDFHLASRNAIGWLFHAVVSAFPFFVAAFLTRLLWTWPAFALNNGPGPLICTVVSSAIFLTTVTIYQNPYARRLCHFSVLLGLWNFTALFLCLPPTVLSVWIYRIGYAIGCLVLLTWFLFWREYFYGEKVPVPAFSRWFTRITWLILPLAGFTPLVVKSLSFDPERLRTASIVPGSAHWPFSIWFLAMVVASGIYPFWGWWNSNERKSRQVGIVLIGTFLAAGSAATTYFLFVEGKSPWYWYPILEFLTLLLLMWALVIRMPSAEGKTFGAWGRRLAGFCLSVLFVSLLVGFLLAQSSWILVAGGGILAGLSLTLISGAIQRPVQEWVDQTFPFRKAFGHIAKAKEVIQKDWNLDALEQALPLVTRQVLETTPYRTCTIAIMFDDQPKRPFFHSTYLRLSQGELIEGVPWPEPLVLSFMQMVRRNGNLCLREEIADIPPAIGELDPLLFEAATPLKTGGKIVGVVVLGPKEGRKTLFHHEDLKILTTLADTLSQRLGPSVGLNLFRCVVNNTLHDVLGHDIGPLVERTSMGLPIPDDMLKNGLRKMRDVIRGLRSYAQGELEKQKELVSFDVENLLKTIYALHKVSAEKKGLQFLLTIPPSLPHPRLDPVLVERCVANLVTNAIKYTVQGSVELTVFLEEKFLAVRVSDTGIGIARESLSRIFEEGYRVPGKAATLAEGTGVGLSNVRDIMVALGGRVKVESEIGRGSRFYLYFPLPYEVTEVRAVAREVNG